MKIHSYLVLNKYSIITIIIIIIYQHYKLFWGSQILADGMEDG